MSFEAFNKDKDKAVKNNLKSTINPETSEGESVKKPCKLLLVLKTNQKKKSDQLLFLSLKVN